MANIFTITTAQQTLKADAGGAATAVFVVTNATARPLRGIAKIKPLGNTQAEWLKIEGETERDFPAGGTHQFTVRFDKPRPPTPTAPTAAETFPFRFDAISAVNPDEDFTEGPTVTVEVPEQKVEAKKPFPWWILIVIGVLLIVGAIVAFLLLRNGDGGTGNQNTQPQAGSPTPSPTLQIIRQTPESTPIRIPGKKEAPAGNQTPAGRPPPVIRR